MSKEEDQAPPKASFQEIVCAPSHHLVPHQNHLLHLNKKQKFEVIKLIMITIRNVSWAANQYIRMISDGSCDTEDWSNDAENSALHDRNKLHFNINLHDTQLFKV